MTLRVAFNATPLLSTVTGIGNYIIELGAAFSRQPWIEPYSFYRYRWQAGPPRVPDAGLAFASRRLVDRIRPWVPMRWPVRSAMRYFGFASGLRRFHIDLYHEQNYVPLSYDVPVVITIHDLSWIRYPEAHPIDRVRWAERGLAKAVDRASAILVDSDFIRDEVLTTFGIDETLVHTAHLGVASDFRPRGADETRAVL